MRQLFLALLVLLVAAPSTPAQAEEDVADLLGLQVRNRVELGKQPPAVLVTPKRAVKAITLTIKPVDGGAAQTVHLGAVKKGREEALEFEQREGSVAWVAELGGVWADGKKFSFAFKFESTALSPLSIDLEKKDVDLEGQKLEMRLSRPADRIEYVVVGDGGRVLDRGEVPAGGKRTVTLRWRSGGDVVETINVKAYDDAGFWAGVEITPFEVQLPHDEVEFEFGQHDVRPGEEPKLEATLARLREVLEKHGQEIKIQLYIAGYTDTVGSRQANLDLSDRRAKAIATWFRKKGVTIDIFHQGFGEDVLAVGTPDETREARNRRALYVLSAGTPSVTSVIPRAAWKKL